MSWLLLALGGPVACKHPPPEPAVEEVRAPPRPNARARSHYMQAHVWREQGDLDQAAASLKMALLFDARSPTLWLELGDTWHELGDTELARDAWQTAAEYGSVEAVDRLAP